MSSIKGCGIKIEIPSLQNVFDDNMCGMYRKTSTIFIFLGILGMLVLTGGSSSLGAEEDTRVEIALIGDSLTQGYGLMPEDSFVSQLQRNLDKEDYNVKLLNFGVSGDTTAGGLERFEWSISSSISGVVIILGGNDLLRGIAPSNSFNNLKSMILKAKAKNLPVLLVGIKASENFGDDFKMEFDQIFKTLQTEFNLLLYEDFFEVLRSHDVTSFLAFMQEDGIHPNTEGIKEIVNDFFPIFKNFLYAVLKST